MKQCLIIDDAPVIRKVARRIVENFGCEVMEAEDAKQALEMCGRHMPGLILLDWQMPGMSAHDFLVALARRFPDHRTQILYCTTTLDPDDIAMAFSGGISDFILKPYDRESLQEKLANLPAIAA